MSRACIPRKQARPTTEPLFWLTLAGNTSTTVSKWRRTKNLNSYHDFWVITTFRKKADKIRGFHQKSRDNFLQIFRKSENSSRKCRAKSRDNFFSETDKKSFFCDKVIKLFKPLMRYAPKSSSVNVSCKELSRLFTELISEKNREIFGNPQKVITTFL